MSIVDGNPYEGAKEVRLHRKPNPITEEEVPF